MYLDKVFLINLPGRIDRLEQADRELSSYGISYHCVDGIYRERGSYGLWLTLYKILKGAQKDGMGNILVLEDDVTFLKNPVEQFRETMEQMKGKDWDLLYLGANVDGPLQEVVDCPYIFQSNRLYATHAVVYSPTGRDVLLQEMDRILQAGIITPEPVDVTIVRVVQPRGKSFICNPLLATQRAGYSDIEKREVDYKIHIEDKFNKRLKELR